MARTTRRTVLWYAKQGVFQPTEVNKKGYRFYTPEQVVDFQVVLLLRKFQFSLPQIKSFVRDRRSLMELFITQRERLSREAAAISRALADIDAYYKNIRMNGTLVQPEIVNKKAVAIFYLEKTGKYIDIARYCTELIGYISNCPKHPLTLAIFLDRAFRPKNSKMHIGIVRTPEMSVKASAKALVKKQTVPAFKSLTVTHVGAGEVVSMLWQELFTYMKKKKIVPDERLAFTDMEYYHPTHEVAQLDAPVWRFELCRPIL